MVKHQRCYNKNSDHQNYLPITFPGVLENVKGQFYIWEKTGDWREGGGLKKG